jgi:hypothetical protein
MQGVDSLSLQKGQELWGSLLGCPIVVFCHVLEWQWNGVQDKDPPNFGGFITYPD